MDNSYKNRNYLVEQKKRLLSPQILTNPKKNSYNSVSTSYHVPAGGLKLNQKQNNNKKINNFMSIGENNPKSASFIDNKRNPGVKKSFVKEKMENVPINKKNEIIENIKNLGNESFGREEIQTENKGELQINEMNISQGSFINTPRVEKMKETPKEKNENLNFKNKVEIPKQAKEIIDNKSDNKIRKLDFNKEKKEVNKEVNKDKVEVKDKDKEKEINRGGYLLYANKKKNENRSMTPSAKDQIKFEGKSMKKSFQDSSSRKPIDLKSKKK